MSTITAIASRGFVRKERREDMLISKIDKVFRPSVIKQLATIAEENPYLLIKHMETLLPGERNDVIGNIITISPDTGKHISNLLSMMARS